MIFALALSVSAMVMPNNLPSFTGPDTDNSQRPQGIQNSDSAPNSTRPGGSHPQNVPSVFSSIAATNLGNGHMVSEQQVERAGILQDSGTSLTATGTYQGTGYQGTGYGGIQYRILYNGMWSFGPASFIYDQSSNALVHNTDYQNLWSYEVYPSGGEVWHYWGRWSQGYYNTYFYADAAGWHQLAIYGDRSGWSNSLWVYVSRTWPSYEDYYPPPYNPYPRPYDPSIYLYGKQGVGSSMNV
jgi:hypothetical protein